MISSSDPVVIVAAKRTPVGRFNGYYRNVPATELASECIESMMNQNHLAKEKIETVFMGCVLPAGLGQAPARQAAIKAGLDEHVECVTINKVCGSGLQTIIMGCQEIEVGRREIVIAGGMENMTRAPFLLTKARNGYRIGKQTFYDHMTLDGLEDAYSNDRVMGHFAEDCVKYFKFTREQQDEYAKRSVQLAQQAGWSGFFTDEIVPIMLPGAETETILDEGPLNAKIEKISTLKPAFDCQGTITAANSSSISDGAATVLLMKQSCALSLGLTPLAKIIDYSGHAQSPQWFTTAPIMAIKKLLQKINWNLDQVDLFEINEAFAIVVLVTIEQLKIPLNRVNIHGGACVLGHPLGASGCRILVTLIHALQQKKLQRGIAAICIGGGEALAMAIERWEK